MADLNDKNLTQDVDTKAYIIKELKKALSSEDGEVQADVPFIKELFDIKYGSYGISNSIHYGIFTKALESLGDWTKVIFGLESLKTENIKGSFRFPVDIVEYVSKKMIIKELLETVPNLQKKGRNRFPKESLPTLRISNMADFYGEDLMYTLLGIVAIAEDRIMRAELGKTNKYNEKLKYVRDTFLDGMFKDSDDLIECLRFTHLKTILNDKSFESESKDPVMLSLLGIIKYSHVLENLKPLDDKIIHRLDSDEYTAPKGFQTPEVMKHLVETLNGPYMEYVDFMDRHKGVLFWGKGNDSYFSIEAKGASLDAAHMIVINGEGVESREAITWTEYMIESPIVSRKIEGLAIGKEGVVAPNKTINEKLKARQEEQAVFAVNPQDKSIYVLRKENS